MGCNSGSWRGQAFPKKFQYPLRVEVGCNSYTFEVQTPHVTFQYPLRVEVGCNTDYIPKDDGGISFSTLYGSKWVATERRHPYLLHPEGFSTLYGSKWVATAGGSGCGVPPKSFSTLYGSKWVATPSVNGIWRMEMGFSTLYGSKWVATSPTRSGGRWRCVFQYPLRVEVGCNEFSIRPGTQLTRVSVPSTGRSGLQPPDARREPSKVLRFSTLYGSKWVATLMRTLLPPQR